MTITRGCRHPDVGAGHLRAARDVAERPPAPQIVFHAAAHRHVHLMEENHEEAITNNVVGTRVLVDAALQFGTKRFVAISTDKAVSPTGIMGASKRMAGMIVRDAGRRSGRAFVVIRFGNVLGSRGSVVPFFLDRGRSLDRVRGAARWRMRARR